MSVDYQLINSIRLIIFKYARFAYPNKQAHSAFAGVFSYAHVDIGLDCFEKHLKTVLFKLTSQK